MGNYAILRFKNLVWGRQESKNGGSISAAYCHNFRTSEKVAPNADPEKKHLNRELNDQRVYNLDKYSYRYALEREIKKRGYYKEGTRHHLSKKDNDIAAVEALLTFSPEMEKKIPLDEWAEKNMQWLREEFGAENVLSAVLHLDESTPHIHAIILPFTPEGKLSKCSVFEPFENYQDKYANFMQNFGLERGKRGSKKKYISAREYRQKVYEENRSIMGAIPEVEPGESAEEYKKRVEKAYRETEARLNGFRVKKESENEELRYRNQNLQAQINEGKSLEELVTEKKAKKFVNEFEKAMDELLSEDDKALNVVASCKKHSGFFDDDEGITAKKVAKTRDYMYWGQLLEDINDYKEDPETSEEEKMRIDRFLIEWKKLAKDASVRYKEKQRIKKLEKSKTVYGEDDYDQNGIADYKDRLETKDGKSDKNKNGIADDFEIRDRK